MFKPMARRFGITAALCAIAGCGSANDAAVSTGDGDIGYTVSGDEDATNIRLDTSDGQATVDTGSDIPPNLPDGIAVYPGATISNVTNVGMEDKGSGAMVSMKADDGAGKVAAWYRKKAEASGYSIESETASGKLIMMSGESADGREFNLSVAQEVSGSTIQLVAGKGL